MDDSPEILEIDEIRTLEALESRTSGQRFLRFNPELTMFRKGFGLCVQLIDRLGDEPPRDNADRAQRDLACDTLDSLWIAEHALLHGYENHALVLLRRAYETTSLLWYFINYPARVANWEKGEITPSDIRKELDSATVPESGGELGAMDEGYRLFAHVNRETVFHRLLGEDNRLTLGCQGNVGDETVGAILGELLRQALWFIDVFNSAFAPIAQEMGREYMENVLDYRGQAQHLAGKLPALFP